MSATTPPVASPDEAMRLIAYVRVSTADQQARGHSLDADQPERLAAYCQAYDYQLVDVIADQVSARKVPLHRREGGAQLLARLEAGDADGVIVVKLDRLFRDLRDGLEYFKDALYPRRRRGRGELTGPQVVSVSEHIDTSTAAGRHMLKFMLLDADAEADRTSERTAHAMRGLRKRGRVYGNVPYGCVAAGGRFDADRGRVVDQRQYRDPATWPMRETIVQMRRKGMSLRSLSRHLAEQGVTPPAGGVAWPISTLADLVRSHDSLTHLPLLPSDIATPQAPTDDTDGSAGGLDDATSAPTDGPLPASAMAHSSHQQGTHDAIRH